MATKKKNIEATVAPETTNEALLIEQENAIEALVPALEEAAAEAATEPTAEIVKEVIIEVVEEAKKRVKGYAQTAISLEDHFRLTSLKNHWKESLNLTVSNAEIITAALDLLSQTEHLEAFMKQVLNQGDQKQRNKDLKKLQELQAKLGVVAEPAKA